MSDSVLIRRFRLEDLSAVYEIECEVFGSEAYSVQVFRQLFDISGDFFLVAEISGIAGYVIGAIQYGTTTGWILDLAVRQSERGKGVGEKLLREIIGVLAKEKTTKVRLTVDPANIKAIGLYRRFGFADIGHDENYFGPGESRIIMEYISTKTK